VKHTPKREDLLNKELKRIGVNLEYVRFLEKDGQLSIADASGKDPIRETNFKTLLAELKSWKTDIIYDHFYDGDQRHIWQDLFTL
jgi:hypothetical protein